MPADPLSRRASLDAVVLGLSAILGTGVFIVFAPAAALSGGWLPLAIVLAGAVAAVSALSEADLSGAHPGPGTGYRYGRERLAPRWGRLAGVATLLAKTAAAAAAGLVFGDYVLPSNPVCVALPVIVVAGGLNAAGLRWTVRGAWFLVPGVLVVLAVVVVVGLTRHVPADWSVTGMAENAMGGTATPSGVTGAGLPSEDAARASYPVGPLGVLGAAGLVFFAFAGFAAAMPANRPPARGAGRSARPSRPPAWLPGWWPSWLTAPTTRPPNRAPDDEAGAAPRRRRAIGVLLLISLLLYLVLAAALLHTLGIARLSQESAPLAAAVGGIDAASVGALVRVCAAAATACALFGLLAGVGRTTVVMAGHRDLPRWLGPVGARGRPWFADLAAVVVAALIAALLGPVAAVALSACAVLVYYAVVNLAALRLPGTGRRWPAWRAGIGAGLCLGLAVLLPRTEVLLTAAVLLIGCLASTFVSRRAPAPEPPAAVCRIDGIADGIADRTVGGLGGAVGGGLAGGVAGGVVFGGLGLGAPAGPEAVTGPVGGGLPGDAGLALAGGDGGAAPAGGDGGPGPDGGGAGLASDGGNGG
jgi:APA family basic amino acid/polyamine antiporter